MVYLMLSGLEADPLLRQARCISPLLSQEDRRFDSERAYADPRPAGGRGRVGRTGRARGATGRGWYATANRIKLCYGASLLADFAFLAAVLVVGHVLFMVFVGIRLDEARSSMNDINEAIGPRSGAANEMEVNVISASLAIVNHAHSLRQDHLARYKDDAADFWAFHRDYSDLAHSDHERDLAVKIADLFRDLQSASQEIIDGTARQFAEAEALNGIAGEFKLVSETAWARHGQSHAPWSGRNVFSQSHIILDEIEKTLAMAFAPLRQIGASEIMREVDRIGERVSRLRVQQGTATDAKAAKRLRETFSDFENGLSRYLERELLLDRRLEHLMVLRANLDRVLDDEIQSLAMADLDFANNTIDQHIATAVAGLSVLGLGAMLVIVLAVGLLYLEIVRPIQRLAQSAAAFRRGDLGAGARSCRADEIGTLTNALCEIAEDLKSSQRDLRCTRDHLDEVRARGKALECELGDTKVQCDAASRTKAAFLAHMSHELRTPLNGILGLAEMIRMQVFGPIGNQRYEGYLDDIIDCSGHLLKHFDDMLELSSIEFGQVTMQSGPASLQDVVARVVASVAKVANKKQVEVATACPQDVAWVWADAARVEQVLENLVENAVKFSAEGTGVRITVRHDGEDHVAVAVSDQGPGMSCYEVETAMDFFGSVDPMSADRNRGLGLGLSVGNRLVEMQGGTLAIDTKPGGGTVVTVRLPSREPRGEDSHVAGDRDPQGRHGQSSEPAPVDRSRPLAGLGVLSGDGGSSGRPSDADSSDQERLMSARGLGLARG